MSNQDKTQIYFFTHEQRDALPVFVEGVGCEYCVPNYHMVRSCSDVCVLAYVEEGSGVLLRNQEKWVANVGQIFLLPRGENHDYLTDASNPWKILWFNIAGAYLSHLLTLYELEHSPVFDAKDHQIVALFEQGVRLAAFERNNPFLQQKLVLLVTEILMKLSHFFQSEPAENNSLFFEMKQYLDEHIFQTVTLLQLSTHFHLSARQIARVFQKEIGISPLEYAVMQKIVLAKQYLRNTTLAVKDISDMLGFCDPYYFSNVFKKRNGVSPRQYRNQGR